MNPFVENLIRERRELDRALRADPRHKKIEKIDALLAEYGEASTPISAPLTPVHISSQPPERVKASPRKENKVQLAKAAVIAYLGQGGAQHRKKIVEHLIHIGVMGHEKDPLQSLAIYLSRWKNEIVGVGEGNYDLASRAKHMGDGRKEFSLGEGVS